LDNFFSKYVFPKIIVKTVAVSKLPHEDFRKIIKVGVTSYAVILPKSWLRYYGLTEKDQVKVISNSKITIEPPEKHKEPETS
jgi:hypothetical protein